MPRLSHNGSSSSSASRFTRLYSFCAATKRVSPRSRAIVSASSICAGE